jgi:hypothetical protein
MNGPKDAFDFQIVLNYCLVNVIPLHDFKYNFVAITPFLLASYYFQADGEAKVLNQFKQYLPPELAATIRSANGLIQQRMYKISLLVILITFA